MKNLENRYAEASNESTQIAEGFAKAASAAIKANTDNTELAPLDSQTVSLGSYLKMLAEYLHLDDSAKQGLAETILPESLLEARLKAIDSDSHLRTNYPEGYFIQVAPIGCTNLGFSYDEKDVEEGNYLLNLIIENKEDAKTVAGFTSFSTYVHKLLPKELEKSKFLIEKYDDQENINLITKTDRERIKMQYSAAFRTLKNTIKDFLENN